MINYDSVDKNHNSNKQYSEIETSEISQPKTIEINISKMKKKHSNHSNIRIYKNKTDTS